MRFWNHEVLRETEAVLERILNMISSEYPVPLPRGARGRCQKANGAGLLNTQENAALKNKTAFFCLQSKKTATRKLLSRTMQPPFEQG